MQKKKLCGMIIAFSGILSLIIQFFLGTAGIYIEDKLIADGLVTLSSVLAVGGFAAVKTLKANNEDEFFAPPDEPNEKKELLDIDSKKISTNNESDSES